MAVCFMAPQLFTTMQQTAYSILQAQNRLKFRSLILLGASVLAIAVAIPVSKQMGGIGVALCISVGLIIGNLLILNIYYHIKIGLNMREFWYESVKLSFLPVCLSTFFFLLTRLFPIESFVIYLFYIALFGISYILGVGILYFNDFEKQLFWGTLKNNSFRK